MSTELATKLIRALIENLRTTRDDWSSLAMVLEFNESELSGTYGYLYFTEGTSSAVSVRPSRIEPSVAAYAAAYYEPGQSLPVKMLVQFDRTAGEYEVTFEDTDASRWQVTPQNLDQVRDDLRPKFD